MPRKDFLRLVSILKKELENTLFDIVVDVFNIETSFCSTRIGLGYKHKKTGVWLDIFPTDFYWASDNSKETSLSAYEIIKQSEWSEECYINSGNIHYACCIGSSANPVEYEQIFPLQKLVFEGYSFPVPHQYELYVENIYHNHNHFPKTGVEHHDMGRGPLKSWAKKNNIDMYQIKSELNDVLTQYNAYNIEKR